MNPGALPSKDSELAFIMSDRLWHMNRTPDNSEGGFQRLWTAMLTCPAIQQLVVSHCVKTLKHGGEVSGLAVLEGGQLVSGGWDETHLRVWDPTTGVKCQLWGARVSRLPPYLVDAL